MTTTVKELIDKLKTRRGTTEVLITGSKLHLNMLLTVLHWFSELSESEGFTRHKKDADYLMRILEKEINRLADNKTDSLPPYYHQGQEND